MFRRKPPALAFDFVDFGASKGGAIEFALKRLGGRNGLGVDIDPGKVRLMREHGYRCIQGDVTRLCLPSKRFRFVTMSHVLEHMPSLGAVQMAIAEAARISTDFLFIQGPFFDADEYLAGLGLKFFWSSWKGHRCHLKSDQIIAILRELWLEDYEMRVRLEVKDSGDDSIHPLSSPRDQFEYDPKIHPPKPSIPFDRPVYKEIVCCVRLRPLPDWSRIIGARRGCVPLAPR